METARELTENLASLLRHEHDALAEFLVALADFDKRRVWIELGHSSLFYFLTRELRLSNAAAQYRKVAAQLIQEIPGIVEPLRRGDLCLTSIIEAAKVVTAENWEKVLPRFYGLSRREAMEVVAALQPHPAPPVRTVVTSVRSAQVSRSGASSPQALALEDAVAPQLLTGAQTSPTGTSPRVTSPDELNRLAPAASTPSVTPTRPLEIVPLSAEQSRLHLTVSKAFMKKLEAARDVMSHAMQGATPEEILEAGAGAAPCAGGKAEGAGGEAPEEPAPVEGRPHSGPRPARGLEARRRQVPMAARVRRDLQLDAESRARPYSPEVAGRDLDRRQSPGRLQGA